MLSGHHTIPSTAYMHRSTSQLQFNTLVSERCTLPINIRLASSMATNRNILTYLVMLKDVALQVGLVLCCTEGTYGFWNNLTCLNQNFDGVDSRTGQGGIRLKSHRVNHARSLVFADSTVRLHNCKAMSSPIFRTRYSIFSYPRSCGPLHFPYCGFGVQFLTRSTQTERVPSIQAQSPTMTRVSSPSSSLLRHLINGVYVHLVENNGQGS